MLNNLSINFSTFEDGGAYPCVAFIFDQQHLVESDCAFDFTIQTIAIDLITFAYFELLPCDFYNCVPSLNLN